MNRIFWKLSALAAFLTSMALGADAAAQTLVQSGAAGACTNTGSSAPHDGGFILASNATAGATFGCSIDVGAIDIDDIDSAEAFVVDVSGTSNAWARLCLRSIVDGGRTCGALGYSSGNSTAVQTIDAQMPEGDFDDDYLLYLEVYLPKPSSLNSYAHFWGFRILD
jgi:hypothetical protein